MDAKPRDPTILPAGLVGSVALPGWLLIAAGCGSGERVKVVDGVIRSDGP